MRPSENLDKNLYLSWADWQCEEILKNVWGNSKFEFFFDKLLKYMERRDLNMAEYFKNSGGIEFSGNIEEKDWFKYVDKFEFDFDTSSIEYNNYKFLIETDNFFVEELGVLRRNDLEPPTILEREMNIEKIIIDLKTKMAILGFFIRKVEKLLGGQNNFQDQIFVIWYVYWTISIPIDEKLSMHIEENKNLIKPTSHLEKLAGKFLI